MRLEYALLLSVLLDMAKCAIDFTDCGTILEVTDVKFGNCIQTPCTVERYSEVSVEIELSRKTHVPPLDSVSAVAEYVHRGISWELGISPSDTCTTWTCPLQDVNTYSYQAKISFEPISYLRPGEVLIKTFNTLQPDGDPIFCASWDINFV
ncbi:uncharacterized protein LOC126882924 [Diabrotica virgifera virgifera]|uniref:Uncharacterized protein LOC114340162 n=1 Tax=Diabrotica virgifera virgifera TaxID=50390 RepID=A0A6P7GSA1_DIAVI|nr:uncharacterized protein LOC126882924 [Diabrotica virgifera virgifera]